MHSLLMIHGIGTQLQEHICSILILPNPSLQLAMDPYELLNITKNPDGSDEQSSVEALSKDVTLNPTNQTFLRLYLPKTLPPTHKLPLIIFFHGGGFVLFSAASSASQDTCIQRAVKIPALIASVEYRLAPEHRLPAAYDDAVEALLWVRDQARSPTEQWLRDHADFSNCFIMGGSAGGNVAYHLSLRLLDMDMEPLKMSGLILNQPFFGGVENTDSEVRFADQDKMFDAMWELALPVGATRDHEYCNPMKTIAKARGVPRCLVKGFVGDSLLDRMQVFVEALEREGVSVVALLEDEGFHGADFADPRKAKALVAEIRRFIYADRG